ncbi:tRNA glutamyl-Q(34) synthetase GluQRS [uncultured Megasphaera sp.]|jgi:glutamyl-tRNA synthetase|uniref:tRNA glutamyl-Q(34) synthetase GluQRS n=1 Tax=uncultured Megasphaera sp. TaxID=165188 RepID=UPI0025FAB407|nr:tRNA glutamyl-Q(34) synthetase GluQRS [uncultured Megasphaera sp.]
MRGRFAPSPTGYIHLGNVWTAFLAWLQVRQQKGTLILRIEDIDEQRSKPEYTQALLEDLAWLGLDWDEGPGKGGPYGPYIQQERYSLYEKALQELQAKHLLYPCYCSRARLQAIGAPHEGEHRLYDGHCYGMPEEQRRQMDRKPSWRVHVPHVSVSFTDGSYGPFSDYLPRVCGDFVVRRADGLYAYQLAVAVDDGSMGITHVLRGRDLLSSTAQQIWLMEVLGYTPPSYTHVPMLIDASGNRLSKRQQGITVRSLRDRGVQADAILSALALAGGLVSERRLYHKGELLRLCNFQTMTTHDIVLGDTWLDELIHA